MLKMNGFARACYEWEPSMKVFQRAFRINSGIEEGAY